MTITTSVDEMPAPLRWRAGPDDRANIADRAAIYAMPIWSEADVLVALDLPASTWIMLKRRASTPPPTLMLGRRLAYSREALIAWILREGGALRLGKAAADGDRQHTKGAGSHIGPQIQRDQIAKGEPPRVAAEAGQ